MIITLILILAAAAVLWRVVHIIAAVDLRRPRRQPLRVLALAVHVTTGAAGAILYLAGTAPGPAGLLLLLSLAALSVFDNRHPGRSLCSPCKS